MPPRWEFSRLNARLNRHVGGTRLEVLKFGMYIMFPISWMYYFGTNLDNRFNVPDFWPKPEQTHKIPFEREEIGQELERLKNRRLELRAKRLAREEQEGKNLAMMREREEKAMQSKAT